MRQCIIPFCKSKGSIEGVRYFRVTTTRFTAWMQALSRSTSEGLSPDSCVCSLHFTDEDFEVKSNGQKVLKQAAVPTQALRPSSSRKQLFFTSSKEFKLPVLTKSLSSEELYKERPSTSKDLSMTDIYLTETLSGKLESDTTSTDTLSSVSDTALEKKRKRPVPQSSSDSEGLLGSAKKRRRLMRFMHTYTKSPRKLDQYVTVLERSKKRLRSSLKSQKARVTRLRKKVTHLRDIMKELHKLQLISGNAQQVIEKCYAGIPLAIMKRMLANSKRGKITRKAYPEEIKIFASTVQFYSSKAYNYIRKTFDLALPSPSTIRNWLSNVTSEPGFTEQAFVSLKMQVAKDKQKGITTICSLMMDEMSIKKQIDFFANKSWGYVNCGSNIDNDTLELATEVLVLMVVAENGHWKIPLAYFFINSLSAQEKANIVNQALEKIEEVGVIITSITCDGPSANLSMAEKLGALIRDAFNICAHFPHPTNGRKVFIIFDVCHMLKLLRNAWATIGQFLDGDNNIIDYNFIVKLYNIQEKEMLKLGNKLKKAHIEWSKQKMKVNLAAQIFSNSVADALEFLMIDMKHPEFQGAGATIKFIRLIDRTFDLLNSRNPFGKGCKAPISIRNQPYWRPIFDQAIAFFQNCKKMDGSYMTKSRRQTSFLGFITSIQSVIGIFEEYINQEVPLLKYLLTYKLSQDHIELFFCGIRSKNGWNNNPTALQFYYTYKRMVAHHDIRNNNGNCLSQDATTILPVARDDSATCSQDVTVDDVAFMKKYNFAVEDLLTEHDYAIPLIPQLTILTENIVTYIAGFVVKHCKKHVKCADCLSALEDASSSTYMDDSCMQLLNRKTRGGLTRPSHDVYLISKKTEIAIRHVLAVNKNMLPAEANFHAIFVSSLTSNLFAENIYFKNLQTHTFDGALLQGNHTFNLIKTIVSVYSRIRFFNIAKKITEKERGTVIRKTLSKLILFRNQ